MKRFIWEFKFVYYAVFSSSFTLKEAIGKAAWWYDFTGGDSSPEDAVQDAAWGGNE